MKSCYGRGRVSGRSVLQIAGTAFSRLMHTVGAKAPETGCILLGPPGQLNVTDIYVDEHGLCTRATYTPDHATINRKILELWRPSGLEMLGAAHSHPEPFVHLSGGDLAFIRRIFAANPSMSVFIAPVLLPSRFWIRPFLVWREPLRVEEAILEIVQPDASKGASA